MTTDPFAPNILKGKTAFIAGGTSGINYAIAERLGRAGASVFVMSRSVDKVASAIENLRAAGINANGASADVRDYAAVDAAISRASEEFGKLDIVVSGAAGNFLANAENISANGFKTVIDIDLIGTFNVMRASFDHLSKPGASLINISAPQGERPSAGQAHACAAKAGVNMLTQCLAVEWGPYGVRVNAISPGPIADTEGMRRLAPTSEDEAAVTAAVPLRSWGTGGDIADMALYLASEAGRYVNGMILSVDGGLILGPGLPLPDVSVAINNKGG